MPDYSRNSRRPEDPGIGKVVSGKVTVSKKSEGRKLLETFVEEDAHSVLDYIVHDILVPSAKDVISSVITNSVDMLLYGDKARPRGNNGRRDYSRISTAGSTIVSSRGEGGRGRHSLHAIAFEDRADADEVLDSLLDHIDQYRRVSVANYYSACDKTPDWADYKWGWYNLNTASVVRERNGFVIRLPKPEPIE